jgi:uncharacterized protein (DUF1015 family)
MTDVHPFRALRYDSERVDLSRVLAPPYDVVSAEDRVRLYAGDPHSAIRLDLTREVTEEAATDYSDIAGTLARWRRDGILLRDARPAFYGLRQRFPGVDGRALERLGFFGALRLEDYERGVVRPHERTMAAPKADRLKLLRATRTNLSSVFLLYEDRELALEPLLESVFDEQQGVAARDDDGIENELVAIQDPEHVERIRTFLAERPVVIADGHHRYETALAYRDERRRQDPQPRGDAPFERTLAYFANGFAPGNLLLPIHRVVRKGRAPTEAAWTLLLSRYEEQRVPLRRIEEIPELLARHLAPLAGRHAFAVDDGSGQLRIFSRPADGELTVRIVHREVIEDILGLDAAAVREGQVAFPKSALQAARDVRSGQGAVAVYLNPLRPEDVFRVTGAGELLPQKSTYFFPKLPTGLLFRPLEPEA